MTPPASPIFTNRKWGRKFYNMSLKLFLGSCDGLFSSPKTVFVLGEAGWGCFSSLNDFLLGEIGKCFAPPQKLFFSLEEVGRGCFSSPKIVLLLGEFMRKYFSSPNDFLLGETGKCFAPPPNLFFGLGEVGWGYFLPPPKKRFSLRPGIGGVRWL